MRIGPKKTKKILRENETLGNAATIEISTEKNIEIIKKNHRGNLEKRIHTTMLGNNTVRNTKE